MTTAHTFPETTLFELAAQALRRPAVLATLVLSAAGALGCVLLTPAAEAPLVDSQTPAAECLTPANCPLMNSFAAEFPASEDAATPPALGDREAQEALRLAAAPESLPAIP